jgi:ABC-type uncharacterized transport system substrate-binding protein
MRYLLLLFLAPGLYAHPHFFISSNLKIEKNRVLSQWKFDKLNSKLLLFEFDTDKNKILDKKEQERFLQTHFYPLKTNNYNLFLQSDEQELSIQPKNTKVSYQNKEIILEFESSLDFKIQAVFCTIDATLYMAYTLEKFESIYEADIQKSQYDFCIGVTK